MSVRRWMVVMEGEICDKQRRCSRVLDGGRGRRGLVMLMFGGELFKVAAAA